ncbi:hypothetical protein HPP92_028560 [Vanilla planifolia]|uniref:Uncharacterized protein n=1 Tax=Vanilla planifolia TaxID=51239 RepID=A0A835PAG4_VANPL|nr:hypothetical protein HPP92_028560 [Vanilla planifolia]
MAAAAYLYHKQPLQSISPLFGLGLMITLIAFPSLLYNAEDRFLEFLGNALTEALRTYCCGKGVCRNSSYTGFPSLLLILLSTKNFRGNVFENLHRLISLIWMLFLNHV